MRVKMSKTDKYRLKKIKDKKTGNFKWDNSENYCEFFTLALQEKMLFTKETVNSKFKNQNKKITIETKGIVTDICLNNTGAKIETETETYFFKPVEHKAEIKEKAKKEDLDALDFLDVK